MSEITDRQFEALVAMALKPDLSEELTDAEIDQFIKEYDEGKHPLSDKDKDALATSGFRQYLRASLELDKVRAQLKAQAEQMAALKDCKCEGTNSPACGECLECYRRTAENLLHLSNQHHAEIEALNGMLSNEAAKLRLAGCSCDELREQIAALKADNIRDGDWLDQWGSCKVCNGEIPHGHAPNCDIFKLKQQLITKDAEIERLREPKSIADRCYDYSGADDEAFEEVHKIMGGGSLDGCSKPDFKWHVVNVWYDSYDSSIEVVLPADVPPMTREQADKILALGFGLIYESQDGRGTAWTKDHCRQCSPRTATEDRHELAIARAQRDNLRTQLAQAEANYNELQKAYDARADQIIKANAAAGEAKAAYSAEIKSHARTEQQRISLLREVEELRGEITDLKAENKDLNAQLKAHGIY